MKEQPKTGLLYKRGHVRKNWRRRFFALSGSSLRYYDKEGGKLKGEVDLSDENVLVRTPVSKRASDATHFQFEVCHSSTSLICAADDPVTMNSWVQAINKAVWASSIGEMGNDTQTHGAPAQVEQKIAEQHRLMSPHSQSTTEIHKVKMPPPVPPRPSTLTVDDSSIQTDKNNALQPISNQDDSKGKGVSDQKTNNTGDSLGDGWRQLEDAEGTRYYYNDQTGIPAMSKFND